MERPANWRDAFIDLESELCDAHNMATLTAFIVDDCTDRDLLAFAVCRAANLADRLHEKWTNLREQMLALKAA